MLWLGTAEFAETVTNGEALGMVSPKAEMEK